MPPDTDCVNTIKTTEDKLATKKKELETFQVNELSDMANDILFSLYSLSFVRSRRNMMQQGKDLKQM